ncbi:unnamed protein product [Polarella glacialis]|uniref:Uncharacterized protein n=1 Tax=Polarella glacialis TaxID=89957 RepID=A0A813F2H6_POLGL|nr:unnamed protein product [Polarella glacialis]CAE8655706.1 unnamed protein product [Polarella glacialis]
MGSSASVGANAAHLRLTAAACASHAVQQEQQPGSEEKEQDEAEFASFATQSARGLKATTFGSVEFCRSIEARPPTFGSLESSSSSEGGGEGPSMQPSASSASSASRKVGPHGDDHEAWMQQLLWFQPDTIVDAAFQSWEEYQKIHPKRLNN